MPIVRVRPGIAVVSAPDAPRAWRRTPLTARVLLLGDRLIIASARPPIDDRFFDGWPLVGSNCGRPWAGWSCSRATPGPARTPDATDPPVATP